MTEKLVLIDGSGFIYRAYYSLPPMSRADGAPIGAVYGFCQMIARLLTMIETNRIAVIFDAARRNWRNDIYPAYKANRGESPDDMKSQLAMMRDAARAWGLPAIELNGYEADDLIASYARAGRQANMLVVIVSSDKDLMQLVRPNVKIYDPLKGVSLITKDVVEKFGVLPEKVVDVQALAGDSVDNVPGVPGIGIKTAAQLIQKFGSLEETLEKAHGHYISPPRIRKLLLEHAQKAIVSKKLVALDENAPLPIPLMDILRKPDIAALRAFINQNGFHVLSGNGF